VAFPSDGQAAELVGQGDALFHDVAQPAQSLDVLPPTAGDDRPGAPLPAGGAEPGAVVSRVRQQHGEPSAGPAASSGDGWYRVDQVDGSADVRHVPTGGQHGKGCPLAVGDHMMLAAWFTPVDRGRAGPLAPFFAGMCPPSTIARDQSIRPAAFTSASSRRCSRSNTPASVQRRSLRQQVIPDP